MPFRKIYSSLASPLQDIIVSDTLLHVSHVAYVTQASFNWFMIDIYLVLHKSLGNKFIYNRIIFSNQRAYKPWGCLCMGLFQTVQTVHAIMHRNTVTAWKNLKEKCAQLHKAFCLCSAHPRALNFKLPILLPFDLRLNAHSCLNKTSNKQDMVNIYYVQSDITFRLQQNVSK